MPAAHQSAAKAPVSANNGAGDAVHAFVRDGQIVVRRFGEWETVTRWEAIGDLAELNDAFSPIGKERARQIRAALKETMQ